MEELERLLKYKREYLQMNNNEQMTLFSDDSETGQNPFDLIASYNKEDIDQLLNWITTKYKKCKVRKMTLDQIEKEIDQELNTKFSKGSIKGAFVVLGFDLNTYDDNPLVNAESNHEENKTCK